MGLRRSPDRARPAWANLRLLRTPNSTQALTARPQRARPSHRAEPRAHLRWPRWPSRARLSPGPSSWTRVRPTGAWWLRRDVGRARPSRSPSRRPAPGARNALRRRGIDSLYSHQAQALEAAAERAGGGHHRHRFGQVAVLQPPRPRRAVRGPRRAGAVPLSDQGAGSGPGARAARARPEGRCVRRSTTATPRAAERAAIRRRANVVLTNPDMLHVGVLPNHGAWAELFANLAAVVVDEAHVYRGVFGSHVGNVLRRLRRIAAAYGTSRASCWPRHDRQPAGAGRAPDRAGRLRARSTRTARPGGAATAMWNPPLIDEALGTRRSALAEAADAAGRAGGAGRAHDLLHEVAPRGRADLALHADAPARRAPELADLVAPYRAGYTPAQRRELERRLTEGELLAVVTTDALELGIDIGALDAAVCVTFPGTVASLRQMWGRAGRRGPRAGGLHGRRGRAGPVLLPPSRRVPRAPGGGGDPRPRVRADPLPHLLLRRPRGAARGRRRGGARPALAARTPTGWCGRASCASATARYMPRRPEDYPPPSVSLRSASADALRGDRRGVAAR